MSFATTASGTETTLTIDTRSQPTVMALSYAARHYFPRHTFRLTSFVIPEAQTRVGILVKSKHASVPSAWDAAREIAGP